jgi:ABC-type glycerol-3-phosphate transport system substrate-binding protein
MTLAAVSIFAGGNRGAASTQATVPKKNIKFYNRIVEYPFGNDACRALEASLADKYNIESLQVDWGNLAQVIRTGIASGDPCDVYCYWPQEMGSFVQEGMALDLTPYLDADGGAWRRTFNENLLNIANFGGKIYNIPLEVNTPVILANQDMLNRLGITVPRNWNWEQFLDVCQRIKGQNVFPFAMPTDNQKQDWMIRNGLLSLAGTRGLLEQMRNADVPCTDPIFIECFTKTRDVYDKGYMYPGPGAVTLTTDESRAAFYQGRTPFTAEVAAGIKSVVGDAPFNCVILPWPSMGERNFVLGGCGGMFVPANVKDPAAAVEVMRKYADVEIAQMYVNGGMIVPNNQVRINDPVLSSIQEIAKDIYSYEFKSYDARLNDYVSSQALPEIVLGGGPGAAAQALERLRVAAKASR